MASGGSYKLSLELCADRSARIFLGVDVDVVGAGLLLDRLDQRLRCVPSAAVLDRRRTEQHDDDRSGFAFGALVYVGRDRGVDLRPRKAEAHLPNARANARNELEAERAQARRPALRHLLLPVMCTVTEVVVTFVRRSQRGERATLRPALERMHLNGNRNTRPPGGLASIGDSNVPTAMGAR